MSNRVKVFLLKFLPFLFALNSILLFFYFSSSNPALHFLHPKQTTTTTKTDSSSSTQNTQESNLHFHGKPWPILPSYFPWTLNPNIRSKSCEGYFGNGFTQRIDVLKPRKRSVDGWFRCFYSKTLESSICEGGRIRMNVEKIHMSMGGEKLETVMGRGEEEEMPNFDWGAFDIEVKEGISKDEKERKLVNIEFLDQYVPSGNIDKHPMRSLIDSIRLVEPQEFNCDKAPLEETWEALFSSVRYAKNFSGSVCFRHAILPPLGYETALFKGLSEQIDCSGTTAHDLLENPDDRKTARLSEFGEMIRASFGFPVDRNRVQKPVAVHNVLFVRREDYLAHPRHGGKVESRLTNEQEVFDSLKSWSVDHLKCKLNFVNGLFAHMPLKEQIRAIQYASVIIGAHGAGLTHIIAATPNTVILEIISSHVRRPHFALISHWKGLEYHAINLNGAYAKPQNVINELNSIMKNLGC
ncbi:hypothetical protein AQUCO_07800034v1 [Aquilegia coerulea]|uniref:Glycosyltransferase 61 catalytic domain-containing protein n=1 Tax=Aquilegia coerulea TaxID=218851 RepID=A0A2G5C7Z0_AQUCA|nr:hypothetical protein AQUCO_07800034v1 [Aquilegia coerulea]